MMLDSFSDAAKIRIFSHIAIRESLKEKGNSLL